MRDERDPDEYARRGGDSAAPIRYRRRPDPVEAMKWDPSTPSMQAVLSWLRDAGEVFETVGRQLWVEFGEDPNKSWMVVHPDDYVIRKTEGRRYFYAEPGAKFETDREVEA